MKSFQIIALATALLSGGAQAATNLIVNGDFAAVDYNSFASDYMKQHDAYDESTVNIGTDAHNVHGSWASFADLGGNNMLIVNGSNSVSNVVWAQTLTLGAGTYDFSGSAASTYFANPSLLQAVVTVGAYTFNVGSSVQLDSSTGTWKTLSGSFTLNGPVTGTVKLLNLTTDYNGNDFVVDNLTLTAAVPEPETYALMLAGLGAIGFVARRRRSTNA
ncbi:PEP-CTERM sorting domain-containing protein [Paucibacter sp. B2R-40]|uniref:PEP-CTERM sorting domain-containing protein n=1 Tax=Paucibacter sp. B2R-40 TaxID=2893554 RepID=UPI0021E4D4AB|nr:PEP-CTERM sorting domain-containing protein [Paucibacter sp. B2R-40]MCV2356033.1 PEP-CTERM sorting domain-containing protein [Paucibacter sp. B2R-40]